MAQLTHLSEWLGSQKRDKRAWIKIVEAIISILLIMGFFLAINAKHSPKYDLSGEIYDFQRQLLKEASDNDSIRNAVLSENSYPVNQFFYERMNPSFAFEAKICKIFEPCELASKPAADIYVDDILIAANLTYKAPSPLILRLFMWSGTPTAPTPPAGGCTDECTAGQLCISATILEICYDSDTDGCLEKTTRDCSIESKECKDNDCKVPTAQICTPNEIKETWNNYYATHACTNLAACGNCKKTEKCSADGMSWTLVTDWNVVAEIGGQTPDLCTDGKDNNCNGDWDGSNQNGINGVEDPECIL